MQLASVIAVTLALGLTSVARGQATAAPPELRNLAKPYNLVDAAAKGYVSVTFEVVAPMDTDRVRISIARTPQAGPPGPLYFFLPAGLEIAVHVGAGKLVLDASLDTPAGGADAAAPVTLSEATVEIEVGAFRERVDDQAIPVGTKMDTLDSRSPSNAYCVISTGSANRDSVATLQVAVWLSMFGPKPVFKDVSRKVLLTDAQWQAANDLEANCHREELERIQQFPVTLPVLVYAPDPKYPDVARKARIQGTVVVAVVGADGSVKQDRVQRSLSGLLDDAAVAAVLKWRFSPAVYKGKPVQVQVNVEVNFRLPN